MTENLENTEYHYFVSNFGSMSYYKDRDTAMERAKILAHKCPGKEVFVYPCPIIARFKVDPPIVKSESPKLTWMEFLFGVKNDSKTA